MPGEGGRVYNIPFTNPSVDPVKRPVLETSLRRAVTLFVTDTRDEGTFVTVCLQSPRIGRTLLSSQGESTGGAGLL